MSIYLYLKTHNITGLKYLGQTTQDPFVYKGSGIRWINHIEKHGNDVTTEIIRECENKTELEQWGIYYSNLWNIVESEYFANLCMETGRGPVGHKHSEETKRKIGLAHKGKKRPEFSKKTREKMSKAFKDRVFTDEHKLNISKSRKGIKLNPDHIHKIKQANIGRIKTPEELQKLSDSHKGIKHPLASCLFCRKTGGFRHMKRWHFDNCKHNMEKL